ncbi:hypothetical protein CEXT_440141, partial [Caerostris extrusa]
MDVGFAICWSDSTHTLLVTSADKTFAQP